MTYGATPGGTPLGLAPYAGEADDPAPRADGSLAAVAVVLRPLGPEGTRLLLVERAASERDPWSGHMALPGGRRDGADASLLETAIRETLEETAVDLAGAGRVLGRLPVVAPLGPRLPPVTIVPFVFELERDVHPRPRPGEIADVLWTSIEHLRSESTRTEHRHPLENGTRARFPAFRVEGRTVWGLTHRILEDLLARFP